jgi:hypothetical protein
VQQAHLIANDNRPGIAHRVHRARRRSWRHRKVAELVGSDVVVPREVQVVPAVVFHDTVDAIEDAATRLRRLEQQVAEIVPSWSMARRSKPIKRCAASPLEWVTFVAEIGDLRRFDNPRQLMAFLCLVPSERSRGCPKRFAPSPGRRKFRVCACYPPPPAKSVRWSLPQLPARWRRFCGRSGNTSPPPHSSLFSGFPESFFQAKYCRRMQALFGTIPCNSPGIDSGARRARRFVTRSLRGKCRFADNTKGIHG